MARPVALLDVDHTLLFNDLSLNEELLDSLKKKGIIDVYLFTDMTLKQRTIEEREQLNQQLKNRGFNVHGVLTPNDLCWDDILAEEAKTLYRLCFDGTYQGKFVGKEFEDFIQNRCSELPTLAVAVVNYKPEGRILGRAYQDALQELRTVGMVSEETTARSYFAKAFADHLAEKEGYKHNKGLLFDLFLHHLPRWVSSIVIADDHKNVISTISNFRPTTTKKLPLYTMIPVPRKDMETKYYDEHLGKHLDPYQLVSKRIDTHIHLLESSWNPFMRSPQAKIKALKELQTRLLAAENEGIGDIIDHWLSSILVQSIDTGYHRSAGAIIAAHRNIFFSTHRPDVETSTQFFIKNLKEEFSKFVLNQEDDEKKGKEMELA